MRALLMILLTCVTALNVRADQFPRSFPPCDVACLPHAETWLHKTCEWKRPPFTSTKTPGMLECKELIEKTDLCISGRYDMWTGVCDMSQETCTPVSNNTPLRRTYHEYKVAFIRAENAPRIPQDDCWIVRKETSPYASAEFGGVSYVQCKRDEVVTECECTVGHCRGVTITHAGTRCNVIARNHRFKATADASCGRALAGSTVTSNPETGFTNEPSVQCPNADSDTVLFGCYVHSDGTVFPEDAFPTQGVRDGTTCKAPPGCTTCQVTAICTQGGYPGTWHSLSSGNCLCAHVVYGAVETEANKVSSAECPAGETVTSCECDVEGGEPCNGALVNRDAVTCWAFTAANGPKVRAKACCGKAGGYVFARWEPDITRKFDDQAGLTDPSSVLLGTEKPRVSCGSQDFEMIGCTVYSPEGETYHRYMTGVVRVPYGKKISICTTSKRCKNCIVAATCFSRHPCRTTQSHYTGFGPWSECSATCGEYGVQERWKYCRSPLYGYCSSADWSKSRPLEEKRPCNRRPCFRPYLLVGVRFGIDKVNLADGIATRIVRIPNGSNSESIRDIGYDYHFGYIFYIVRTDASVWTIRRCSMIGEDDQALINFDTETRALTIDTSGLRLWYATDDNVIENSDYNGGDRRIIHQRGLWSVEQLAFYAKYDSGANTWERKIFWRETADGGAREKIMSSTETPWTAQGPDSQTIVREFSSPYSPEPMSLNGNVLYWWQDSELHETDMYGDINYSQNLGALVSAHGHIYVVDTLRPLYIDTYESDMYIARRYPFGSGSVVSRLTMPDMEEEVVSNTLYNVESVVLVHEHQIPSNGMWTSWSSWTDCSSRCYWSGIRTRRRACDPPPFLQTLENGCQGWDHQLDRCSIYQCDVQPRPTYAEKQEGERMAICRLYVDDASLEAVESELPTSKANAQTLPNCRTQCEDRSLTCAQSLRVRSTDGILSNGKPQVEKKPCSSKWVDLCCCV